MTFGLTPQGFLLKRLADIKTSLENAFIAEFGDINIEPQSVFGQEIGVLSKSFADLWENLQDVYFSQYPNSASGVSLDNVVQLNAITRLPATQTSVVATCAGNEGTTINQNALAKIPSTNQVFYNQSTGIITQNNADIITVQVGALAAQPYTVILSNHAFTYSLPILTFSNSGPIFVSGNSISITINGTTLAAVPYNSSSNQTLADVASAIQGFIAGTTATPTNPNIISVIPPLGFSLNIQTPLVITGGATQATSALTYAVPTQNNITANLVALANAGTPSWTAVDHVDGTFTITANSPGIPFSSIVGTNLSVIYVASPFIFLAENFGPIPCPAGTLTQIVTPIGGWNTITNMSDGVIGRFIETDAALRFRRSNSIKLLGLATVEAIRSQLLQNVTGVTSALVFENRTLTETNIVVVFPSPFVSGDSIAVIYDTIGSFAVAFNTDQATTMANLVTAFEGLSAVASASYGGSGNQTLTIVMNPLSLLFVNAITTNVSAQTASINGGRPPKSFEAVVEGGSDQDVALKIWQTKPAGIETFGNINNGAGVVIVDSQGDNQTIFFSRPTPLYIWVQVALTLYALETFPVNGVQLVQQAIYNYGASLGVGVDVLFQRVLAQIFNVQGIASGAMTIAVTTSPTNTPSYATSDIIVQDNQISIFNLDRIFVTVV